MANTKQAAKRARKSLHLRAANVRLRTTIRTAIKDVKKAIANGDKAAAEAAFKSSQATIDAIARKRIVHRNKAARHKSRLAAQIKALGART